PWWIVMPDIASYLQRSSFILRQGTAVNDVALYLPNDDGWAHVSNGNLIDTLRERVGTDVISSILESGYGFDFFDDDVLMKSGRVDQNKLVLGAASYRVVIVPGVERIPLGTLQKLEEFARNGGIVIATGRRPDTAPGFSATDAEQKDVSRISQSLFSGP